jgi:hypothetical protein
MWMEFLQNDSRRILGIFAVELTLCAKRNLCGVEGNFPWWLDLPSTVSEERSFALLLVPRLWKQQALALSLRIYLGVVPVSSEDSKEARS